MVKKLPILFGQNCNISASTYDYELKFSTQTKFDTMTSNLNSYFQYKIVMTSLWRNIQKISKTIRFISSDPHIYWSSVTNYFLFGRYFNYGILFHKLCWKSKIFERQLKNGTIFAQKASTKLMTSSEQGKRLLCLIQRYCSKAILVLNLSAKFE